MLLTLRKRIFSLYHTHIYVFDEEENILRLGGGAGQAGEQMVEQGHTIAFDSETSIVARAAREQVDVVINDVLGNPFFLPNPLLPDTRAEAALPLIVGNQLVGVLDVFFRRMQWIGSKQMK